VVVGEVEATDLGGDNQAAAAVTLEGESLTTYERASSVAADDVAAADAAITRRFDKAADADIHPVVPLVLGVAAAALAVAGILGRGRRYR
jgi:hypothetical protein